MAADIRELTFQNVLDTILKPAGVKVGGFPHEIFQDLTEDEKEKWICNICFLLVNEARQCDNEHLFCHTCIFAWTLTLGENSRKCPMCRADQRQYSPNKEIDRLLSDKRVQCPDIGCTFKSPLKILLMHSHGRNRYSNQHVDLESLRPSRTHGAHLLFLPLIGTSGGSGRASNIRDQLAQGRMMIHQMMLLLQLEMQLRQQALVTYSRARDPVSRMQSLDEVLALNEQLNEVGTILSGMLGSPMNGPGTSRGRNAGSESNRQSTPVPSLSRSRSDSPIPVPLVDRPSVRGSGSLIPSRFREGHGMGGQGDDGDRDNDEGEDDLSTSSTSSTMSTMMTTWRAGLRNDLETPGGIGDLQPTPSANRSRRGSSSFTPDTLDFVRPQRGENQSSLFGTSYSLSERPTVATPNSVASRRFPRGEPSTEPTRGSVPSEMPSASVAIQPLRENSSNTPRDDTRSLNIQASSPRESTLLPRIDHSRIGMVSSNTESTSSNRSTNTSSSRRLVPQGSSALRRTLQSVDGEPVILINNSPITSRDSDELPSSGGNATNSDISMSDLSNAPGASQNQTDRDLNTAGGISSVNPQDSERTENDSNHHTNTGANSTRERSSPAIGDSDELPPNSGDQPTSGASREVRNSHSAVSITPFPEAPQPSTQSASSSQEAVSINKQATGNTSTNSYAPQRRFRRESQGLSRSQELPRRFSRTSVVRPRDRSQTNPMLLSQASPTRPLGRSGGNGSTFRRTDQANASTSQTPATSGTSPSSQRSTAAKKSSRTTIPVDASTTTRGPSTPGQLLRARRRSEILQDLMFTSKSGPDKHN